MAITARTDRWLVLGMALLVGVAALVMQRPSQADIRSGAAFVTQTSMLSGLEAGAVYPFIDTTPRGIVKAHIAVTDQTASCEAGAAAPSNVQVLVGQAGVVLEPVMSAATNTGISTVPGQCVFHVTVRAGRNGLPAKITDIAVLNGSASPLSGINTITVSATVR